MINEEQDNIGKLVMRIDENLRSVGMYLNSEEKALVHHAIQSTLITAQMQFIDRDNKPFHPHHVEGHLKQCISIELEKNASGDLYKITSQPYGYTNKIHTCKMLVMRWL